MRKKTRGFTIVEILTVLAIISLLVGILLPALNMARNAARTAKEKVQITSIEQALFAFRNDNRDYPPSDATTITGQPSYGGAQKLAEALLGWDLMGCHRLSKFTPSGTDEKGIPVYYSGADPVLLKANLAQRMPKYLELETANDFTMQQLIPGGPYGLVGGARVDHVLCDVFGQTRVNIGNTSVNVGMPILYYKANPSGLGLTSQLRQIADSIYRYTDNYELTNIAPNVWTAEKFVNFITDTRAMAQRPVGSWPWPYKTDSFILISAGIDGLYGTQDDITNFGQ